LSFITGQYTLTYDGYSLGQADNGFETEEPGMSGEKITGDNLGPYATQDGVYLPGDYFLSFTSLEYNAAGIRRLLSQPYVAQNATGTLITPGVSGVAGLPGQLWSSLAKVLVLTKVNQGVLNATPLVTRTCHAAILAPNFPIRYLMSPRHRKVPIRFQLLPTTVSNVLRYWTDLEA